MSAGLDLPTGARVHRDLDLLAPRFREAVEAAIAECNELGLDAYVYEGYRTRQLQEAYYQRGRTEKPPKRPVTNARSNLYSWHGYGLAVDVISREHRWNRPFEWWAEVASVFRRHGCDWGGDWRQKDLPHFQWGRLKASPSDRARELYAEGGVEAVWIEVGAA